MRGPSSCGVSTKLTDKSEFANKKWTLRGESIFILAIGKAEILYGEDIVATVDLVAAEDVELNIFLLILGTIKDIFSTTIFKILFAIAAILLIIYILLIIRKNRIKAKRNKIRMIKG